MSGSKQGKRTAPQGKEDSEREPLTRRPQLCATACTEVGTADAMDDVVFFGESTRAERDVIGRASAVVLDASDEEVTDEMVKEASLQAERAQRRFVFLQRLQHLRRQREDKQREIDGLQESFEAASEARLAAESELEAARKKLESAKRAETAAKRKVDDAELSMGELKQAQDHAKRAAQGYFQVFYRNDSIGKTKTVEVRTTHLIEEVKAMIAQKEGDGITPEQICLIWSIKVLEEGRTIGDYGIGKEATLHVRIGPRTDHNAKRRKK